MPISTAVRTLKSSLERYRRASTSSFIAAGGGDGGGRDGSDKEGSGREVATLFWFSRLGRELPGLMGWAATIRACGRVAN